MKLSDTTIPQLSVFGDLPPWRIANLLTQFKEDYPEGKVRPRNCVIYGPVEEDPNIPYVAIYRTVGGSIVMRKCEDEDSSDQ